MHATEIQQVARIHSGVIPPSWISGTENFQKAKVLAAIAWSMIKPAEDPELPACDITFQESCVARAESVLAGNTPDGKLGETIQQLLREIEARAKETTTPCTPET